MFFKKGVFQNVALAQGLSTFRESLAKRLTVKKIDNPMRQTTPFRCYESKLNF